MKIGIITHYNVHNHGALLQLYGLKTVLERYGHTVAALTFKKNFDFMPADSEKKYNISIKSLVWYLSYIKQYGIRRTYFNFKKKGGLDSFRKPMVGEYYSRAVGLDAAFIGSDEVFSLESGLNSLFFGYGIPCESIFSYAGCFGPYTYEKIEEKHLCGYVGAGLSLMKQISVRDENSRSIVEKLTGQSPLVVCDPVILYGYEDEQNKVTVKLPKQKYLLIYAYDNNMNDDEEVRRIKAFAKSKGLLVASVGFFHKWADKNINADPMELLQYFKNAEYVVTDTFHGSVISLITNVQFATKLRGNGNKLADLLNRFSVANRITEDFSDLEKLFLEKINYITVNEKIEDSRKKSFRYIENCLTGL